MRKLFGRLLNPYGRHKLIDVTDSALKDSFMVVEFHPFLLLQCLPWQLSPVVELLNTQALFELNT